MMSSYQSQPSSIDYRECWSTSDSSTTSSSSSSSSPSMCLGSADQTSATAPPMTTTTTTNMTTTNTCNMTTSGQDLLPRIQLLTNTIKSKLYSFQCNNNQSIGGKDDHHFNDGTNGTVSAQELSKLYAIRGECYLSLGFYQLAFDDCVSGSQLDPKNSMCHRIKGRALLKLNRRESAEQSFQMSHDLSKNMDDLSVNNNRYTTVNESGLDGHPPSTTANMFAPKNSRSVNDAIGNILNTSLTSGQLSSLRDSYTRSLNTNESIPFGSIGADSSSTMSGIFGNTYETNGTNRANGASQALGLKLISDIDNCLGSIHDTDEDKSRIFDEKIDNNIISATNYSDFSNINNNMINKSNNNNNFCDMGDSNGVFMSRSLSPQTKQNVFGVTANDLQLLKLQKANNFSIDLNKDSLGSQIVPKNSNNNNTGVESTRKTFADIASANTKKPVQTTKMAAKAKTIQDIETKDIVANTRSQTPSQTDTGNKVSSLESFGALPTSGGESVDKIEKIGQIVVSEPTRPTNLMAYKGLWVCNISPNASYITLKKVFRKYGNFTGIQTFERKATNGSNIVFVHYDNQQSPTDAIAELFGVYRKDICFDENTLLKLRFTPSMEQTKNGELPSMEKARRVVEKSAECFNWRLSTGCHKGDRCSFKHIAINKAVDSQPWVKALKKKANDA